ncbi:2Fe-2S iron-sulfur cluster binding domain protein [Pandoraea thiooxydans]|nr:2Fe-2S iron-sulfur cluster binding domain protein [Pandoraea thiooxydans]
MTTCEVTVINTGEQFSVDQAEIILDSALAQGIRIPHQCRGASCGTCKVRVLTGAVDHGWSLGLAITDEEKGQGYCLLCQARAITPELRIEIPSGVGGGNEQATEMCTEVLSVVSLTPRVKRVVLATPADRTFVYPAGSYLEVLVPGVDPNRMYSLASACRNDGLLELFVSRHAFGEASGFIHDTLRVGDLIRVRGPFGACRLPDGAGPVIGLAGGTGLAPVLAILEDALERGADEPMLLLHSVSQTREVFALDRLVGLSRRHDNFKYQILVTDEQSPYTSHPMFAPAWIRQTFSSLATHRAVIGGSPGFVEACAQTCISLGLDAARISTDSFVPSERRAIDENAHP